ncbi:hypothetical protein BDZ91DRAFT_760177 [Kalaharituber pfeilii]|nr:hypothetical protein BDZ91DRAFT_760177 [Kalaharituber pfeilii]
MQTTRNPINVTGEGATTQVVRVEKTTVTYSHSIRSEHPDVLDTPYSEVPPLPSTAYVPEVPPQAPARQNKPINGQIGAALSSELPRKMDSETLHTDVIPGKTVPPVLLPESPAAESYYHASSSHTPSTIPQATTSSGLRFDFSPPQQFASSVASPKPASSAASPPPPIQIKPLGPAGEWRPPPQTPTRSLSLSNRPSAISQITSYRPSTHSHTSSGQSHRHSDSNSSTTGLISGPSRTRSFSGNKPSPFKLNPNNQTFPGPPVTPESSNTSSRKSDVPQRMPTSKFSDDGDDHDDDGSELAKKQWSVHFTTPLTICMLFFCGLVSAALHHIFYSQLHDTSPSQEFQEWHFRAGVAISVFTIACWVGCTAVCYKQHVWTILGQKNVKISGIDALWGLIQDPSLFFVKEAWRKSKVAMGLGIILWTLPLTTIFVPGALTVLPQVSESKQPCMVPTFDQGSDASQRAVMSPEEMDRILKTKPAKDLILVIGSPRDSILTVPVKKMSTTTAFSGKIINYPFPEGCGNQGNCSYTISFTAPGWKCDVMSQDEAKRNGPWSAGELSDLTSTKGSTVAFYSTRIDNKLAQKNDSNTRAGVFWVAFRALKDEFTTADPSLLIDPTKATENMFESSIFRCVDHIAKYNNVKFEWVAGQMGVRLPNTEDQGIQYIAPVDYSQFSRDGQIDVNAPAIFNRVAHDFTFSILTGKLEIRNRTELFRSSQIEGTDLMDMTRLYGKVKDNDSGVNERYYLPKPNLKFLFEELHRNVTFSFLSDPRVANTFYTSTMCLSNSSSLIYHYKPLALLLAYGIACFFTSLAIIVGIISLRANGFATDFSFSRILCTTRNTTLDTICKGESCTGTVTDRVERQELRFGEVWVKKSKTKEKRGLEMLREEDDIDLEAGNSRQFTKAGHAAFGMPSEHYYFIARLYQACYAMATALFPQGLDFFHGYQIPFV